MALPDFWRERATGLDDRAAINGDNRRVWDWNVYLGDWPHDLEFLQSTRGNEDFTPGFVSGGWYVDDVSMTENGVGTGFVIVSQSWRRLEYENPLNVPFRITSMESIDLQVPAYADFDGKVLQTTAGEPLLGMTRTVKVWRFTGTRNIPGIPAWLANYGKATNSDIVRLGSVPVPANCLQLASVRIGDEDGSTKIAGRSIIYRPMELELWWNPESWTTEVLNMGFYELVNVALRGDPIWVPMRIARNGQPVDSPQFLGEDGRTFRDEQGNLRSLLKRNEIIVLKFNMFERLSFSKLIS